MASPSIPAQASRRSVRLQILGITFAAVALYTALRQLPTGTNLSHLDFRVENGNSIEFCDPANPQFIPVVAVRSPVEMLISVPGGAAVAGAPVAATVKLSTASGKPIAPEDLLISHTEKLHLLILDPTLSDYQHVHPTPGKKAGEWNFEFTPHAGGLYRVFADFTPAATARGLYANADLQIGGSTRPIQPPSDQRLASSGAWEVTRDGYVFQLTPSRPELKAREPADFSFSVRRADGKAVKLEPVMDAYAHLVAVDEQRSGFAHLHPAQLTTSDSEGGAYSGFNFKVTIPRSGRYVIWAQVRIDGRDVYAPFWCEVV
jgi:hypothetical protein